MSRSRRRPPISLLLGLLALAPSLGGAPESAFAAPQGDGGPSDAKRAEAKVLFDEGAVLYTQGSYEEALAKWEEAYFLSEEPLIFENMANAYERLGDLEKAREHLLLWREEAPESEHATLDKRLSNLAERIARNERKEDPKVAKPVEPNKKPIPATGSSVSIPGLILTGVGLAAVGGGIAVGVVAAGQRPEESEVCSELEGRSICLQSSGDDIDTSSTLAAVSDLMWIAGAVTGTVGIVLLLTHEPDRGPAVGATLRPTVAALPGTEGGSAGMILEGTW
jgi:hypothetical protein